MTFAAAGATIGLRERKKRRTRETIASVALELFARDGYDATTIADIAAAADVAPRTVSAYFPSKEDLLFPDRVETIARFEQLLAERGLDEMAPAALQKWVRTLFEEWRGQEEVLRARYRLVDANEALQARDGLYWREVEDLLAAAIADDLGSDPTALEPRMAAASATAVLAVIRDDLQSTRGSEVGLDEIEADVLARLDQAAVFMTAGIRALRDSRR